MVKSGDLLSGFISLALFEAANIFATKSLIYFYKKNKKQISDQLPFQEDPNQDSKIEMIIKFIITPLLTAKRNYYN